MWDFLDGIVDVGLWLAYWRVYISIAASVVVGLIVNSTFAASTSYIANNVRHSGSGGRLRLAPLLV